MTIAERLRSIKAGLPEGVELVAVSKYHPETDIEEAYRAGQRVFGENLAQELARKAQTLPRDIRWHFIGHLQRNKVKLIAPFVSLVEGVDSLELLRALNREACRLGRTIDCLLQIHIAKEETKFGLTPSECLRLLEGSEWRTLSGVRLRGLMCIATNTDDREQILSEFNAVAALFEQIRLRFFQDIPSFNIRSWGMSDDYPLAILSGSNMVRIGTAIFGSRPSKPALS